MNDFLFKLIVCAFIIIAYALLAYSLDMLKEFSGCMFAVVAWYNVRGILEEK